MSCTKKLPPIAREVRDVVESAKDAGYTDSQWVEYSETSLKDLMKWNMRFKDPSLEAMYFSDC